MHILFQFSNCQVVHLGPHTVKLVPRQLALFYLLLLYNMHTISRFQKHISILYILYGHCGSILMVAKNIWLTHTMLSYFFFLINTVQYADS